MHSVQQTVVIFNIVCIRVSVDTKMRI